MADEKQMRVIRGLGAESDSISRELARYIVEVGGAYSPGVKPMLFTELQISASGQDATTALQRVLCLMGNPG